METILINEDIKVMYVTAASFPEGIQEAFDKLRNRVPISDERRVFGISRPESENGIIYRAGVEELKAGEASEYGLEALTLKKGSYISTTIHDFVKDMSSIGRTFGQMLEEPGLDLQGYCVEVYSNRKDVLCMVRLDP